MSATSLRPVRWLVALFAPLLLWSCILSPTKFDSTLDIRADRSFTFTYVGEVQLAENRSDLSPRTGAGVGEAQSGGGAPDMAAPTEADAQDAGDNQSEANKLKALADTLSKEYGFRSARYVGNRTLAIDYQISGTLDHSFVFPFNPDGEVILPFITVELRGKDRVRVKAPGYANDQNMAAAMAGLGNITRVNGAPAASSPLDGRFTLTTDAEIVSQNQEDGAQRLADGSKQIVWRATPQSKDAPMAVLRLAPHP